MCLSAPRGPAGILQGRLSSLDRWKMLSVPPGRAYTVSGAEFLEAERGPHLEDTSRGCR